MDSVSDGRFETKYWFAQAQFLTADKEWATTRSQQAHDSRAQALFRMALFGTSRSRAEALALLKENVDYFEQEVRRAEEGREDVLEGLRELAAFHKERHDTAATKHAQYSYEVRAAARAEEPEGPAECDLFALKDDSEAHCILPGRSNTKTSNTSVVFQLP